MRLAPLACVVAGVLALTACGTSGTHTDPTDIRLTGAELDLLTRSGTFTRTSTELANAESELIATCMAEKGFRYRAEIVDPASQASGSDEERTLNMADRRTRGYGLGAQYGTEKKTAGAMTNDAYVAALPENKSTAYMKALRGDSGDFREMRFAGGQNITFSERGCESSSRKALYGNLDDRIAVTYFPQNLNSGLTPRVENSPKYRAAMKKWQECMRGKGYTEASPDTAYELLKAAYRADGATSALRAREIAVATADGECAAELHIPATALALRRAHAQSLPTADKLQLRRLTAIWESAAAEAARVR